MKNILKTRLDNKVALLSSAEYSKLDKMVMRVESHIDDTPFCCLYRIRDTSTVTDTFESLVDYVNKEWKESKQASSDRLARRIKLNEMEPQRQPLFDFLEKLHENNTHPDPHHS